MHALHGIKGEQKAILRRERVYLYSPLGNKCRSQRNRVSDFPKSPHTGEEEWPLSSQAKEALEPDMRGDTGDSGESKAAGRHLGFGVCTWWKITMIRGSQLEGSPLTRQREDSRVSRGSWLESQVKLATLGSAAITWRI